MGERQRPGLLCEQGSLAGPRAAGYRPLVDVVAAGKRGTLVSCSCRRARLCKNSSAWTLCSACQFQARCFVLHTTCSRFFWNTDLLSFVVRNAAGRPPERSQQLPRDQLYRVRVAVLRRQGPKPALPQGSPSYGQWIRGPRR